MKLSLFAAISASLVSVSALAQESAPAPAPAPMPAAAVASAPAPAAPIRKLKDVSLTFSPLHLIGPILEVMGEYRVSDKVGVSAIGGIGSITVQEPCITLQASLGTCKSSFSAFEAGAQGAYYVLGDFNHGLQLGAEVLYAHVASKNGIGGDAKISGNGVGLAVSPFVGYKYVAPVGLTLLAQVGPSLLAARAEATDGTASATSNESAVSLMLNLNAGWSF